MERLTAGALAVPGDRRAALVTGGVVLAAGAAWVGFDRWMGGMPGVGADLGAATFAGSWTLMMAAMMLPSMTPVVSLYDRMRRAEDIVANVVHPQHAAITEVRIVDDEVAALQVGGRAGGRELAGCDVAV